MPTSSILCLVSLLPTSRENNLPPYDPKVREALAKELIAQDSVLAILKHLVLGFCGLGAIWNGRSNCSHAGAAVLSQGLTHYSQEMQSLGLAVPLSSPPTHSVH